MLDNGGNIPSESLLALPLVVVPFVSHLKCLNLEPVTLGAAGLWPSLALSPDLPTGKTKKLATALLPKCHNFYVKCNNIYSWIVIGKIDF